MREIEFRAYIKDKNKIFNVKTIDFTYKFITFEEDNNPKDTMRMIDQVELMQYTGLKDKNGTKIFEGDIVNMLNITDYPMQIKWNKKWARFIFYNLVDKTEMNLFTEQCEVIGNIYDNPELIKE